MASPHKMLAAAMLAGGLTLSACQTAPQEGVARGETLYGTCEPCHGPAALGKQSLGAPNIAGLESWYIQAQVEKFRTGVRGAHPDDMEGARMRPMARSLRSADDVAAVSDYVAGLPGVEPASTLSGGGDAAKGAGGYALCSACHGADGKGNQAMNAPGLTGHSDWYMLAQLNKFKSGQRGADPRDTTGATMRPMAMTLADEQAMLDVIAHIQTLP